MEKRPVKNWLSAVIVGGAVWGFSEAALGMGLRKCAASISGSLMTGAALFFIAFLWFYTRRFLPVFLMIVLVSLIKTFDALLLSLPFFHGAAANPIFAFFMEGLSFLLLVVLLDKALLEKKTGQAALGGMSALLAVNLFPLVKYATGIPACVVPGTGFPLSLYYAPLAVAVSMLTVPFGAWLGEKVFAFRFKTESSLFGAKLQPVVSSSVLMLFLLLIILLRMG
ncbi:MAG: hypothetical protein ACOC57_01240 [Acidobacteriota bacterium]